MKRILALLAIIASLMFIGVVPASATAPFKFTICHATSSEDNPYTKISVPEGASFFPHLSDNPGNNPLNGHEQDLLFEGDVDCPGGPTEPPVTDPPTEPPTTAPPTEPPPTEPPTTAPPTEPPPTEPPPTEPPPTEPPPTETPDIGQFSVDVCPLTGEPVAAINGGADYAAFDVAVIGDDIPAGKSAIQFRHPLLVIFLLKIRIDGQPVTLDGDGVVLVEPGLHTFSISNAEDTEVLAEGQVFCPECNPTAVTEPPNDVTNPPKRTAPPTDTLSSSVPNPPGGGLTLVLLVIGGLAATSLFLTRKS